MTIVATAPAVREETRRTRRKEGRRIGRALKESAHAILEARRERFLMQGRRELLGVALGRHTVLERGKATPDDVRERLTLPSDIGPVCLGAVPKPLVLAGIIRRVGFVTTSRPVAHARQVSVWELVDPDAARQWLADHPAPLPVPTPADETATREPAPVADAAKSGAIHQRSLFGGEGV